MLVRDIKEAILLLKENELPPAVCACCAEEFYLFIPGRALYGKNGVSSAWKCDNCQDHVLICGVK